MFQFSEDVSDGQSRLVALYNDYAHTMWYVARTMVREDHIAEDMVQDVFVKLTKSPEILNSITYENEKAFLVTIVRHHCIDYLRKKKRKPEENFEDYANLKQATIEFMPVEQLIQDETVEELREALKSLPESLRVPLEMHALYDMSNQEIAEVLNISKNLVAVRLSRGRNRLLKELKKRNPQYFVSRSNK